MSFRHVLVAACIAAWSFSAASSAAAPHAYQPNEVIVRFRDGVTPARRQSILAELGVIHSITLGTPRVERLRFVAGSVDDAVTRWSADPDIVYIQPNYIWQALAVPDDPRLPEMWGLQNLGQTGGTPGADIRATGAWSIVTGTHDVVIGVIDTGVDYTHPDLAANMWTNAGEIPGNGVDDDANGYIDDVHGYDFVNNDSDPMDDIGHGTHVAGTIGALGNNALGTVGVCWNVRIMPLKFLSFFGGTSADAVRAIRYATSMGAHFTNNSWGGGGFDQALYDAIAEARDANRLFVAASANNGTNTDLFPNYPSAFDLDNIVAVAATDHNDSLAIFSNYGLTTVDLAAPGVDILSTLPGGGYGYNSGTSMASPHVAGALGLVYARFPAIDAMSAKNLLIRLAVPKSGLAGKMVSGGRLDALLLVSDPDSMPPSAIADLRVESVLGESAVLAWSATGDDGAAGQASSYDIRYSTAPITESNFADATRYRSSLTPLPFGGAERDTVPDLSFLTTYYFAVKAQDEFGNASPISNVASATTLPPPDIAVTPTSVSAALLTGESVERAVTVSNSGPSDLRYRAFARFDTGGAPAAKWRVFEATRRIDDPQPPPPAPGAVGTYRPPGVAGWTMEPLAHTRVTNVSHAGGLRLAFLTSGTTASVLRARLEQFPDVERVDEIDVQGAAPDLATLAGYDAVLLVMNQAVLNPGSLGDVLADYADGGGGVILSLASFISGWNITGRFLAEGYMPFALGSGPVGGSTLGEFDADHPIMRDVVAASGDLLGVTTVADGATLVASWVGGLPFVATQRATVVGINAYYGDPGFWSGDMPLIIHNAALWGQGFGQWISSEPKQGVVAPGSSQVLAVRLSAEGLDGGAYDGRLEIQSNDPDEPVVDVLAHLDVTGAPVLEVSVEPIALTSTRSYATNADSTRHSFEAAPAGSQGASFRLVADGDFGDISEFATLFVEGDSLGSVGGVGGDCLPASGRFPVSTAQLDAWSADGHIDAVVVNTFPVDVFCTLNQHRVTLELPRGTDPLDFGTLFVGLERQIAVTLRNPGTENLAIDGITVDGGSFTADRTSAVIPPRGQQTLTLTFRPTAAQVSNGTLRFTTNDTNAPSFAMSLVGTGVLPPDIDVLPTAIDVTVNEHGTAQRPLHVANVGASDLAFTTDVMPPPGLPAASAFAGLSPAAAAALSGEPKFRVNATITQPLAPSPVPVTGVAGDPVAGVIYAQQVYGSRFFSYVAAANRWDELPPSPLSGSSFGGAAVLDGRVYTSTPYYGLLGSYDVATGVWTTLPAPFGTAGITSDGDRYLYMIYGQDFRRFDPVTQTTDSALAAPPVWFSQASSLVFFENQIYGYSGSGATFFAVYDITSNTWRTLPSLPEYPSLGATIDPVARTLVTGGPYGGSTLMKFDLAEERWTLGTVTGLGFSTGGFAWLPSPVPGAIAMQGELGVLVGRIVEKPDFVTLVPSSGHVAAGATLDLDVQFDSGDMLGGVYHASLELASNDPDEPLVRVPASLTVIGTPDLVVGGEPVAVSSTQNYFSWGDSTVHALSLPVVPAGAGTVRLDYSGDYGDPSEFAAVIVEGAQLGTTQALGIDCTSGSATFTAGAVDMARWAQDQVVEVTVANSFNVDAFCVENRHTVTLSYAAPISLLDFGQVFLGASEERRIQLTNRGSSPLVIASIASDLALFAPAVSALTLPPRSSTLLSIHFSPVTTGVFSANLTLTSNDPDTPVVTLPMTGEGVLPPRATLDPLSVTDSVGAGDVIQRALTLGNTGGSTLTFDVRLTSGVPNSDSLRFEGLSRDSTASGSNNPAPTPWGTSDASAAVEPRFHAQVGELLMRASSATTLTCVVGDPQAGLVYAQENYGARFYRYDVTTDAWSPLPTAPINSENNGGAALLRGRIYMSYTGPAQMGIYSIDTGVWTTMMHPMQRGTGVIASDGERYLYFAEGFDFMRWDVETGTTSFLPRVPLFVERWGGMEIFENALYLHTGNGTSGFARFDLDQQRWTVLPSIPGGAVLGSAIDEGTREYVAYGNYGGNNLYRYSLDQGSWGVTTLPNWLLFDGGMAWIPAGENPGVYMVEGELGIRFAVLIGLPSFVSVAPTSGSVAPGASQELAMSLGQPALPPGIYRANVQVSTNDPIQPAFDVPVSLEILRVPLMQLAGERIQIASQEGYTSPGAATTHTLLLPEPPISPAEIRLDVEGDYSDSSERATLFVEGIMLGQAGSVGMDCVPTSVSFPLPESLLAAISADGRIDALVQNSYEVDLYCPVNLHTVTIGYSKRITPLDFGRVFVGATKPSLVTVRNSGTAPLTVQPAEVEGAQFSTTSGLLVIAPGDDATIEVRFTPGVTGTFSGELRVRSDAYRDPDRIVELVGEGVVPPRAELSTEDVAARLGPELTFDQTVRLSNTGGADLEWVARRGVETGPSLRRGSVLVSDARPSAGGSGTGPLAGAIDASPAIGVAGTFGPNRLAGGDAVVAAAPQAPASVVTQRPPRLASESRPTPELDMVDPSLEAVFATLIARGAEVSDAVPDSYDFLEGVFGVQISDGGLNMYDGGNILYTNIGGPVSYANTGPRVSGAFGAAGGRYFTRKLPGLFVLAADTRLVGSFEVVGRLGANGGGAVAASVLESPGSGGRWLGFSKRVYGAGVPSVNHLFVVEDKGVQIHEYDTNTDNDFHRISGLQTTRRLYYLLYSGRMGEYMDDATTLEIMDQFLDLVDPSRRWLSASPRSGTVPPGGSQDITLRFDSRDLPVGEYVGSMLFETNSPATPTVSVAAQLSVVTTPVVHLPTDSLDFGLTFVGYPSVRPLTVMSLGGSPLTVTLVSSDPSVTPPGPATLLPGTHQLQTTYAPAVPGPLAGTLEITTNDPVAPLHSVALLGTAVLPPQMTATPASVEEIVSVGFTRTVPLALCNTGGYPLTFNVMVDSTSWLSVAGPASGELAPGACSTLTLTLAAAGVAPGIHATTIRVFSTDPAQTELGIDVRMRVVPAVSVALNLEPDRLNPRSHGRWVTACVVVPPPYQPEDVVIPTVRLMGSLKVQRVVDDDDDGHGDDDDDDGHAHDDDDDGHRHDDDDDGHEHGHDHDDDDDGHGSAAGPANGDMLNGGRGGRRHHPERPRALVLKFDRRALIALLPPGEQVSVPITGELEDGRGFTGVDSVKVVRPRLRSPNGGEHLASGSTVSVEWEQPPEWGTTRAEIHLSGDGGASWLALTQSASGGRYSWVVPAVVTGSARLRVSLFDTEGLLGVDESDASFSMSGATADAGPSGDVVVELALMGGTPNPFRGSTRVRYALPRATHVRLEVFDLSGRRCRVLANATVGPGRHELGWNGRDDAGRNLPAGVFVIRMDAGGTVLTRRVALLR